MINTIGRRGATRNGLEGKLIQIEADEEVLSYDEKSFLKEWKAGGKVTPKNYKTFVHEFGHALDYIHRIKFPFYKEIDSLSGLDSQTSIEFVTTNKYKMDYCKNDKDCIYKISPKFNQNKLSGASVSYSITPDQDINEKPIGKRSHLAKLLEEFILRKVKNLKIPGKT